MQVKDVGGTGWLNLKVASTTPTYALTVNNGPIADGAAVAVAVFFAARDFRRMGLTSALHT